MTSTRKKYTAKFKAMVAKEAMKEQLTLAGLSKEYEVSGNRISLWKREAESRMEELFGTPKEKKPMEAKNYIVFGPKQAS